MTRALLLLLVLCTVVLAAANVTHASPFGPGKKHAPTNREDTNSSDAQLQTVSPALPSAGSALLGQCLRTITLLQKQIKEAMAGYARSIQDAPLGTSFWLFLGLTFLYGAIHALGPGHGKTVVSAYCLGHPGGLAQAMCMGMTLAITHVSSATLIVTVTYLLLSDNPMGFNDAGIRLEQVSYTLVTLLGIGIFFQTLRRIRRGPEQEHHAETSAGPRQMLLTAFITGVVPCPGATLILIFTINLDIFRTGLLSMLFLALGMGLTTGLFGMAAYGIRSMTLRGIRSTPSRVFLLHGILSLCAAVVIASFGAVLLLGSLQ